MYTHTKKHMFLIHSSNIFGGGIWSYNIGGISYFFLIYLTYFFRKMKCVLIVLVVVKPAVRVAATAPLDLLIHGDAFSAYLIIIY